MAKTEGGLGLRDGNITTRASARISWANCCLPKAEGGLGLKDLILWNKTLNLKLIWFLFQENESLWASWCKEHRLKGVSLWSLEENKQGSWIWKLILKLRHLAVRFLRCNVGNGRSASFWYDQWTPLGPLINVLGHSGPRALGIPLHSSVAETCTDIGWRLRHARSPAAEALQLHLCTVPLPSTSTASDAYVWEVDNEVLEAFSSKSTWEAIRNRREPQSWTKNIWFKGAIPSQAFMMWMTHLNRLPTRERTSIWAVNTLDACCVCNVYLESRDHLFLRCEINENLWLLVLRRLGYNPFWFHTWMAFTEWLGHRNNVCPITLRRFAAQATIYSI